MLVLYAVGPIHYNEAPQLTTWFFVLASVSAFAIGGLLATSRGRVGRVVSAGFAEAVTRRRIDRVVLIAAILGLFGAACIALDKLLLSGLDFSQGIAAIRFERVEATEAGTAFLVISEDGALAIVSSKDNVALPSKGDAVELPLLLDEGEDVVSRLGPAL